MSLAENLKVAALVASEVREKVPNSSNYAWSSSPVQATQGLAPQPLLTQLATGAYSLVTSFFGGAVGSSTSVGVHQASDSAVDAVRSGLVREMPTDQASWVKSFEDIRDACYRHQVGNCGELAAIACLLLVEARTKMTSPSPIEYVQIWDGVTSNPLIPHLIAVIGRHPNQLTSMRLPLGLPTSWHPDAVVCDHWDRVFYAAHDYDPYWKNLRAHSDSPNTLTCKLLCQI